MLNILSIGDPLKILSAVISLVAVNVIYLRLAFWVRDVGLSNHAVN
jgi:hypothetical protein